MNARTVYFDCYAGISGDMAVAALLDLGADFSFVRQCVRAMGIPGLDVERTRVNKLGIESERFLVQVHSSVQSTVYCHQTDVAQGNNCSNHDNVRHDHHHDSHHDEEKPHSHHHHRSFRDIRAMIERADIPNAVKDLSISIFTLLATAEGRVHGRTPDEVHFHEVGAEDSIADIVAFAAAWHSLGLTAARASSVNTGSGFVRCAHGMYPVPAPAVALLLEEIPVYAAHAEKELTTPTGAAILKAVCSSFGPMEGRAVRTGYGAGTRDLAIPNALRAQLVDDDGSDRVVEITANIDDMNPERYPLVLESLLCHGALDAWLTPLIMKQGRPAVLLSVLCAPERRDALCRVILETTTTIGVRWHASERMTLMREPVTLELSCGACEAKLVRAPSGVRIKPEIAAIRRLADENGLDFVAVYDEAVSVAFHTASTMNR